MMLMIMCKEAQAYLPSCGKTVCCVYCPDKTDCLDKCECSSGSCSEQVEVEETELQVMESAVPEAIRIITDITVEMKKMEEKQKVMKQKLLEAMERHGIKKFENAQIAFTYVAPTTKTTIDSDKLKKELPEIAKKYSKTSNVGASVRIKVK